MFEKTNPTPLQQLSAPFLSEKGVEVFLKREDRIDAEISGNKWRKLKYNLLRAKEAGFQTILTFGGAYSNHIAATATACQRFGFESIGIIRGDELHSGSNPTLQQAAADGMDLQFISRSDYQKRNNEAWVGKLKEKYQAFIIPEGGSNQWALQGVGELVGEIDIDFDYIVSPVGTGGTLAGIAQQLMPHQLALGVSSLKGETYLQDLIEKLGVSEHSWKLLHDYHFGGYAKFDNHLVEFINQFYAEFQIPLDPIYTGKMMFAIFDLIKKGKFKSESRIICVHTGGLQGIAGFNNQHKDLINT